MALGQELKDARMRMSLTASEVASATRMKVQIVEAIEDDDFSVFAAPIYGKGFIRLYAEYVGLDPRPLVDEFTDSFTAGSAPRPKPKMRAIEKAPAAEPEAEAPETTPKEVSPAESAAPQQKRRSGSARAGRQFDLFNDLPAEDEPIAEPAPEPVAEPVAEPEASALPLYAEPEVLAEPDPEPDVIELDPEPVILERDPAADTSEPEIQEPDPDTEATAPAAATEDDEFEDPQDILSPSLKSRIEKLFGGSGDDGDSTQLPILQLVLSGVGILVILIFIVSGISRCARGPVDAESDGSSAGPNDKMVLGIDMPEPYFD